MVMGAGVEVYLYTLCILFCFAYSDLFLQYSK